jgi:hypothetical protein
MTIKVIKILKGRKYRLDKTKPAVMQVLLISLLCAIVSPDYLKRRREALKRAINPSHCYSRAFGWYSADAEDGEGHPCREV